MIFTRLFIYSQAGPQTSVGVFSLYYPEKFIVFPVFSTALGYQQMGAVAELSNI